MALHRRNSPATKRGPHVRTARTPSPELSTTQPDGVRTNPQRALGNRAAASLLAPQAPPMDIPPVPKVVAADDGPVSFEVPASLAHRAMRHGTVEFGHSDDPARTLQRLAREDVERPGGRTSWRDDTLVLPGLGSTRQDASSERSFAQGLRESLPFQRFRLTRQADALALEGKINPWVRLHNGALQVNHSPQDADLAGWQWVDPIVPHPAETAAPPAPVGAAAPAPAGAGVPADGWVNHTDVRIPPRQRRQSSGGRHRASEQAEPKHRAYILPWWGDSHIVLPMKGTIYPDSSEPTFAGGLPSLVGGRMGTRDAPETIYQAITREMGEELPLFDNFNINQLDPQFYRQTVNGDQYYLGQAYVGQRDPNIPVGPMSMQKSSHEMRGWTSLDVTQLGVTHDSPSEEIALMIANHMLPMFDPVAISQKQIGEFFTAETTSWMVSRVRLQLGVLYDRAVYALQNAQPAANDPISVQARVDYRTALDQLRGGQPVAPTRAAPAAQAAHQAAQVPAAQIPVAQAPVAQAPLPAPQPAPNLKRSRDFGDTDDTRAPKEHRQGDLDA